MKSIIIYFLIVGTFLNSGHQKTISKSFEKKINGTWIANHGQQIWTFNSNKGTAQLKRLHLESIESFQFEIVDDQLLFYNNDHLQFNLKINSISDSKVQLQSGELNENLFLYKANPNLKVKSIESELSDHSFSISNFDYLIESNKDVGLIKVFSNGNYKQIDNFELIYLDKWPIIKIQNSRFIVLDKKKRKYLLGSLNNNFIISELKIEKNAPKANPFIGKWNATFETDNNIYKDTLFMSLDFREQNECFIITNSRVFNPIFVNNKVLLYNTYGIIKPKPLSNNDETFEYLFKVESKNNNQLNLIRSSNSEYESIIITSKRKL